MRWSTTPQKGTLGHQDSFVVDEWDAVIDQSQSLRLLVRFLSPLRGLTRLLEFFPRSAPLVRLLLGYFPMPLRGFVRSC